MPMLGNQQGMLDPMAYGSPFAENPPMFQSQFNPQPQQQMSQADFMDPRRAAWAAALSNMGNIIGGHAPSQNIGGAYAKAKGYNDRLRLGRTASDRQESQDELQKRYVESQIAKNEMTAIAGGGKGGAIGSPVKLDNGNIGVTRYSPESGGYEVVDTGAPFRAESKTHDINGVTYQRDPITGNLTPLVDLSSPEYLEQINQKVQLKQNEQSALDFTSEQSKWQAGEVKYLTSINAAEQKQEVVQATADEIRKLIGEWTVGGGGLLKTLPGTDSRKLAGLLDTLKANSAFTSLKDMKASGATLGAIAAAELNLLEREWGALDQLGKPDEMLRVLTQLVGQNSGSLQRMRYGFDENKKRYGSNLVPQIETPAPIPLAVNPVNPPAVNNAPVIDDNEFFMGGR